MTNRTLGVRQFAAALAFAGLSSVYSSQASACADAAASPAAAGMAIAAAAKADANSVNGVIACLATAMEPQAFRAAIVEASAQISDRPLAMLVVELGASYLFDQLGIIRDPRALEPEPDSFASGS